MTTPTLAETLAAEILSEFYGGTTDLDDISEAIAMSHAKAAIRALRTYCARPEVIERVMAAVRKADNEPIDPTTHTYDEMHSGVAHYRHSARAALASLTGDTDG